MAPRAGLPVTRAANQALASKPSTVKYEPLPPAEVEYVEKQPSLEDVFFAVVGHAGEDDKDGDADKGSRDRTTKSTRK